MQIRAAVLFELGKPRPYAESRPLSIETVDLAPPGPDEVLVEIGAAGLCHTDLSVIEGGRARVMPAVLGHEAAGVVREIGHDVTGIRPGDHVVISFVSTCGVCPECSDGRPNLCRTHWGSRATGALPTGFHRLSLHGQTLHHHSGVSGFAEMAVVSRNSVVPIDRDVPMEDAALFGCAVMTGVGAVLNTARLPAGSTVAVVGLGGVGLSALLGCRVAGAARILALDVNGDKLALARQLGATETFDAADPDCAAAVCEATSGGVDFGFEMAGRVEALALAYGVTRRGGTTVTAGLSHQEHVFPVPHAALVSDERTLKGSYMGSCSPRRDIPRFVDLYRRGLLPVDRLRSGTIGLDGMNVAFDRLAEGAVVRQMLVPGATR
jgi:alcohol dehydrogenase